MKDFFDFPEDILFWAFVTGLCLAAALAALK